MDQQNQKLAHIMTQTIMKKQGIRNLMFFSKVTELFV